jgi:hypothetical protein
MEIWYAISPITSGGIVSSMLPGLRVDKYDDSESNGDSHLKLGTRVICHDRPSFSRVSFTLLGYWVCPVMHPVCPSGTAHCSIRPNHTSWQYCPRVFRSCARNHIHIHLHQKTI